MLHNVDSTLDRRGAEGPAPSRRHAGEHRASPRHPAERVGIKATTNETMGFVGRGEGIAALAIATIDQP